MRKANIYVSQSASLCIESALLGSCRGMYRERDLEINT